MRLKSILILSFLILSCQNQAEEARKPKVKTIEPTPFTPINNEIISKVFKTMERKLFYYIMTPAMTLSWLFGLVLIHEIGFQQLANMWLQLKLILVSLLTAYHFYLGLLLNQFKLNQNKKSSKFYRYINEIPTLLLILIVFIVIFKPI